MKWNWQLRAWPEFRFDAAAVAPFEADFLHRAGVFRGASLHLSEDNRSQLLVELISEEAVETSSIEGEILNRESVQSSLRRAFGFPAERRQVPAAEAGIAAMMADLYRRFDASLSHELLWDWHRSLMKGRRDVAEHGRYRTGAGPMQVVSGPVHEPKVHFEAPPTARVRSEMDRFTKWFNATAPTGQRPLSILTRAGMAHLYFVCIHPFEDGNGRVGRAVAEKAILEGLHQPIIISLSRIINDQKREYYRMLERANTTLKITPWLIYFAQTILKAQEHSQRTLNFLLARTKFHDQFRGQLNERQEKAIARMMREGPAGFTGGLSAGNYIRITGASPATATRDLNELVGLGALARSGQLKSTRYSLNLPSIG